MKKRMVYWFKMRFDPLSALNYLELIAIANSNMFGNVLANALRVANCS